MGQRHQSGGGRRIYQTGAVLSDKVYKPVDRVEKGVPSGTPIDHVPVPDLGHKLIPKERYTSTDFLELEWQTLWTKVWLLGGMERDLEEPGDLGLPGAWGDVMASLLLVEDDALISRMISLRLRAKGHQVDQAENGRAGVEKALAGGYDLVLMDMYMPEMDGHEAVRQLREQGYRGTVVAVTASAMSRDSRAAVESGCDHIITKPIGDDFEQRIADILAAG